MQEYIDSHLPYLVHDCLDDLVPDFGLHNYLFQNYCFIAV